jgi:hypothetical protein
MGRRINSREFLMGWNGNAGGGFEKVASGEEGRRGEIKEEDRGGAESEDGEGKKVRLEFCLFLFLCTILGCTRDTRKERDALCVPIHNSSVLSRGKTRGLFKEDVNFLLRRERKRHPRRSFDKKQESSGGQSVARGLVFFSIGS